MPWKYGAKGQGLPLSLLCTEEFLQLAPERHAMGLPQWLLQAFARLKLQPQ
ncbi:hypothetical protein [Mumia zhuanghuii]|uniref:hypothetical protein n=1 Tax=Mumia zhuanghuii TaxID=2585211 RepID=UPI00129CFDE9|nr:hypothetical protein [Mumia zhuanghuii]